MRPLLGLLLTALLVTAGCLGSTGEVLAGCEEPLQVATFHGPTHDGALERAPGQAVPILLWVENPYDVELEVTLATHPQATAYIDHEEGLAKAPAGHRLEPGERSLLGANVQEALPNGSVAISLLHHVPEGAGPVEGNLCDYNGEVRRWFELAEPIEPDATAEPGKGVLVRTVGVWRNGTSFYTNHGGFHDRTDLPRSYLGNYSGNDPLKVYVYNDTGDEMPERYDESGYATTIPGFNEALEGLPTVGARFTAFAPAEGYTQDGNEDHPLYGDALAFYIEAIEVRTVPCEVPQPVCDVPSEDDVPPPTSSP